MARFIEFSEIESAGSLANSYDIAFVGNPLDMRGQLSVSKAHTAAPIVVSITYDPNDFSLKTSSNTYAANRRGFEALVARFPGSRILLDTTTLEFPEILLLIKSYLSVDNIHLGFLYTEPESYAERDGAKAENLHSFELRERFQEFTPIPGFTPLLSDQRTARLLAFVGFESSRLMRILIEDEGARIKAFSMVFGVPPFKASWEMHSFMQNANALNERNMEDCFFVGANNPSAAYDLICKVANSCSASSEVITLAPLGTKPMSIGIALYAAQNSANVRVIYDYPTTRLNSTHGVGKIHHYQIDIPSR